MNKQQQEPRVGTPQRAVFVLQQSAVYQEMARVQGLEREDEQIAYDRERDALADQRYDQQYADMLAAEEYDKKATRAAFLAQIGNFSGYAELWGLSQEETAQLVAEYARQKQLSEQQAAYELEAMGLNNQLLKKQVARYGNDIDLDPTLKSGPTPLDDDGRPKMDPVAYSSFKGQITNMLRSGSGTTALALVKRNESRLSDTELEELEKLFGQYGHGLG